MQSKYGFGTELEMSFAVAVERVTQALQVEGFGVLADIDVAATLQKKLNQMMPPYRILGACNPSLAHRALEVEPSIGLLLPCNVVVREDAAGKVHVEFMDPQVVLTLVDKPEIAELAGEVRQKLERVLTTLGGAAPETGPTADEPMTQMQARMQRMQAQMERIRQAQDPTERQRLMQEHMQAMRESMRTMHGMMGSSMQGKCMCCGR
ncbi:DUF302 domain-containing protein [Thermithiobacillus tepidarius DSM 3134]|uniref:DUF302 domain-containing protein n=1 Tax=Thermithiobacillus tepidarius TaxID=929 RepID=UPI00040483A9|nr:DUF302 domain-containing protein [Thermithiobacillus tepidarius]